VAPDVRPLPRSLENIFKEYAGDLGLPAPSSGDLSPWAQRGVLMLNRVLTVQPGNSASHRGKGWEAVTECAIRALVDRGVPMVAILWGRDASTLKPMLTGKDCLSIESAHPSPLSASRGFFGSRPFSRANELLVQLGAEPIDWRLP
jgi:uracil-DNA glycosylase